MISTVNLGYERFAFNENRTLLLKWMFLDLSFVELMETLYFLILLKHSKDLQKAFMKD